MIEHNVAYYVIAFELHNLHVFEKAFHCLKSNNNVVGTLR